MACLRAAIIAYDNTSIQMTGQEIGQDAFSGVSETKIYHDVCTQRENTPNQNKRCCRLCLMP